VTTQTLTPVQFVADGAGLDITANLAAPTQTTLLFTNTGREMLFVAAAASSETVTVDVGALVDGQTVTNFSAVTLTSGHTVAFGPFHSVLDQNGTSQIQVVLSVTTNITVGLFQTVGVY
jgi:phosphatidylserine decarboxylase